MLKAKQTEGSVEINMLCKILDRTLRNFRTYKNLDINSLKDVAAIRAAFSELPAYFNEDISENLKSNSELRKCIQAAKHLCENESALQLFLLKQLVHNDENGFDGVKERCKIKELKWILPPQSEVTTCSLISYFIRTCVVCFILEISCIINDVKYLIFKFKLAIYHMICLDKARLCTRPPLQC